MRVARLPFGSSIDPRERSVRHESRTAIESVPEMARVAATVVNPSVEKWMREGGRIVGYF